MSAVEALQTLLTRVQQRAAQPRARRGDPPTVGVGQSTAPDAFQLRNRTVTRQLQRVRGNEGASVAPEPELPPANAAVDESIEQYPDELVELIDDSEVSSESHPEASPMPALQLDDPLQSLSEPPVNDEPIAQPVAAVPRATLERVQRAPAPAVAVAVSQGQRLPLHTTPFLQLLDRSLQLGE